MLPTAMQGRARSAGIAIAMATLLSTLFVALDQSPSGDTPLAIMQSLIGMRMMKALVHSVAIASVAAYAYGFSQMAIRLGFGRQRVLAGATTYLLGCFAMVVATTFDGFISSDVAEMFVKASPEGVKQGFNLIIAYGATVGEFAKIGWVLQSVAALSWASVLVGERGLSRIIGVCGLISSAIVIGAVVLPAQITMPVLLGILISQAIWHLAAATWLIRDQKMTGERSDGSVQSYGIVAAS